GHRVPCPRCGAKLTVPPATVAAPRPASPPRPEPAEPVVDVDLVPPPAAPGVVARCYQCGTGIYEGQVHRRHAVTTDPVSGYGGRPDAKDSDTTGVSSEVELCPACAAVLDASRAKMLTVGAWFATAVFALVFLLLAVGPLASSDTSTGSRVALLLL